MRDDGQVMQSKEGGDGRRRANDTFPPTGPDTGVSPHFTEDFVENPRLVLIWAVGLPAAVFVGVGFALEGADSAGQRLLGAGVAVTAVLLVASFVLRYFPQVLHHEWWGRSRTQQLAKGVLLWAWVVFLVGTALGWVVSLIAAY
jgi:predicted permease